MPRYLFSLLILCCIVSLRADAAQSISFNFNFSFNFDLDLAEGDTHFLELNEWAERNHLFKRNEPIKKIDVTVVGCAGTPECYFFYQKYGRMHVYDPRLKKDWTRTLRKGASLERLRSMHCYVRHSSRGKCNVFETARTRTQLIASAPAMARSLGMFVRSPAKVAIIKNRRLRN